MQKYSSSAASCPRAPRRCAVYQCTVLYYAMQEGQEMTVSMENLASYVALVCHWLLVEGVMHLRGLRGRQTGSRLQVLQPTVLYCPTVCDVQSGEREHHPAVRHHVGVHPGRVRAFQVLLSATVLTPLQLCFPQFVTDFLASPLGFSSCSCRRSPS